MSSLSQITANLNGIDYVVLFLLFFSTILGIKRGFIKEIVALATWVTAFVVASLFATRVADLFTSHAAQVAEAGKHPPSLLALCISYLLLFLGTLLCGQFIEYIISYVVEGRGISILNRFFGAIFGLIRGWFLIIMIMFVVSLTALNEQPLWQEAKTVKAFKPAINFLNRLASPYLELLKSTMKEAGKRASQDISPEVIKAIPEQIKKAIPEQQTKPVDSDASTVPVNEAKPE